MRAGARCANDDAQEFDSRQLIRVPIEDPLYDVLMFKVVADRGMLSSNFEGVVMFPVVVVRWRGGRPSAPLRCGCASLVPIGSLSPLFFVCVCVCVLFRRQCATANAAATGPVVAAPVRARARVRACVRACVRAYVPVYARVADAHATRHRT